MRTECWSGRWLVLLGVLAPLAGAWGQETTHLVRGQVVDLRTGLPVAGAEIFVLGQTRRTVADATGHFRHGGLAPGSYLLQVRKAGYLTMTWQVATTEDSTVVHLLRVHSLLAAPVGPEAVGAIQARVVDRDTGTPVADAEVVVVGRPEPTVTDGAGRFRHTGLAPAAHVIHVKKVGYEPLTIEVVAREDITVEHVLELRRSDIPVMDTLIVEAPPGVPGAYWLAGFEERRAGSRGQFVTRPEIEQRNAASLGDLLRTLNGLRMRCTGRGCTMQMTRTNCRPAYFADGFPADATTVERMPVNDLYGVEVYDLFEVPVELQRAELRCGVIAVWTRRGPPPR